MAKKKLTNRRMARSSSTATKNKAFRAAASVPLTTSVAVVEDERGRRLLKLRDRLGMNREMFARLVPVSVRHLASIEGGREPTENVQRRLTELRRVIQALSEVIQDEAVGPWLTRPNDAFGGLKPLEFIERGEVDRIWQMIFFLRSGVSY